MARRKKEEWSIDEWDDSLDSHSASGQVSGRDPADYQASGSEWDDIPPEWQNPRKSPRSGSQGRSRRIIVAVVSAAVTLVAAVAAMKFLGIFGTKPSGGSVQSPVPAVTDTKTPLPLISNAPTWAPEIENTVLVPVITNTPSPTPIPVITDTPAPESALLSNEWYSPELRYYYRFLSENEKKMLDLIYTAAIHHRATVQIGFFTETELDNVYYVLKRDCPELFNLTSGLTYYGQEIRLEYRMDQAQYDLICSRIHAVFDTMASSFPPGSDDFEKQLVIYRYLIHHCDYLAAGDDSTAYADACLYKGKSQCSGYACALELALRHFGIQCIYVSNDGSHAWNMVCIGNQWYNCDATWDDTGTEGIRIPYDPSQDEFNAWMNLPDRLYIVENDHRAKHTAGFPLPEAVGIQDSYAKRKAVYIPAGDPDIAASIDRCLKQAEAVEKHYVLMMLDDQSYLDNWDHIQKELFSAYGNYDWVFYPPNPSHRCIYAVHARR